MEGPEMLTMYSDMFSGYSDTLTQSGPPAAACSSDAEAGPLLSVQFCGVDTAHGYVHSAGSLAGLYLVLHWQDGTGQKPAKLDCR